MESKNYLYIFQLARGAVADFAAGELARYLRIMSSSVLKIDITAKEKYDPGLEGVLWLGLFDDFGIDRSIVDDPELDDAVHIDVANMHGVIAGINVRSILTAVYKFLDKAGCKWVRPGIDGEYVPARDIGQIEVQLTEKAAYRHRGICIEGAVSFENMKENIEWAPKLGFNSYFLEFEVPYTFFDRWYSHKHNEYKKPESVSVEKVREYTSLLEDEIKKRGLSYHAVGHAWTCEPFGIPGLGWDREVYSVAGQTSVFFAQVNGKRELWQGIPLNTNLCYSNPEARRLMIEYAVNYLLKNKKVDVLHFWLADGKNNHCECENCRNTLPSDFYIKILNELDELLTQKGISTKIVFLLYFDLLWAPVSERLNNPDRFIMMFAPITRTYSKTYSWAEGKAELPPYERNKLRFPSNIEDNISFLKSWQDIFKGDSFAYEYHFMWDHYYDPGYYSMAEILSSDIKNLAGIGLNGLISDQTQRSFFPTGLGMYVMGRTLWDSSLSFDSIAEEYFTSAFGADGNLCRSYLKELSRLFDPSYLRGEKPVVNEEAAEKLGQIPQLISSFDAVISRNINNPDSCHRKSWEYMKYHAEIAGLLSKALKARAEGRNNDALALWNMTGNRVKLLEDEIQPVFDVFEFIETLKGLFK